MNEEAHNISIFNSLTLQAQILPPRGWEDFFSSRIKELEEIEGNIGKKYCPHTPHVFKAFRSNSPQDIRVLILGQDPYHNKCTTKNGCFPCATGDAFSVPRDTDFRNPSLKNILNEVKENYPQANVKSGNLENWVNQGVMLLNTALTVDKKSKAASHLKHWKVFIIEAIKYLLTQNHNVIFVLWGGAAKDLYNKLGMKAKYVLTAGHPSPLNTSIPFSGCQHFTEINEILKKKGCDEIDWSTNIHHENNKY